MLSISPRDNTNITIENIQFLNGEDLSGSGAGLEVNPTNGLNFQGKIILTNNAFISNHADLSAALELIGHTIRVENNLFALNHSINNNAIRLLSDDKYGIYFINNTVVYNTTDSNLGSIQIGGALLYANGSSKSYIANNIFWGNEFEDLHLAGTGSSYLYNNDIEILAGIQPTFSSDNLSVSADFQGLDLYRLNPTSPLINKGLMPPEIPPTFPSFLSDWILPDFSIEGKSGVQGDVVDIGVFETEDVIFTTSFEMLN